MDKDMISFAVIVVVAILVVLVVGYFFSRTRSNRYINYVDEAGVKTGDGESYQWNKLKKIHYINKYVMGKGLMERNYGIVFYFEKGKATIDLRSNIYHHLFAIAQKAKVPATSVVTKGLLRAES
jgi:hypothetical protein